MSGAFQGDVTELSVDAFYQKGTSVKALLEILENVPKSNRFVPGSESVTTLVRPQQKAQSASGGAGPALACASCLRALPEALRSSCIPIPEADCFYCRISSSHAAVQSNGRGPWANLS
jgi:hypothetical protein